MRTIAALRFLLLESHYPLPGPRFITLIIGFSSLDLPTFTQKSFVSIVKNDQ